MAHAAAPRPRAGRPPPARGFRARAQERVRITASYAAQRRLCTAVSARSMPPRQFRISTSRARKTIPAASGICSPRQPFGRPSPFHCSNAACAHPAVNPSRCAGSDFRHHARGEFTRRTAQHWRNRRAEPNIVAANNPGQFVGVGGAAKKTAAMPRSRRRRDRQAGGPTARRGSERSDTCAAPPQAAGPSRDRWPARAPLAARPVSDRRPLEKPSLLILARTKGCPVAAYQVGGPVRPTTSSGTNGEGGRDRAVPGCRPPDSVVTRN